MMTFIKMVGQVIFYFLLQRHETDFNMFRCDSPGNKHDKASDKYSQFNFIIFFLVSLGLCTIWNLFISVRLKNNHQIHRLGYWAVSLHHR